MTALARAGSAGATCGQWPVAGAVGRVAGLATLETQLVGAHEQQGQAGQPGGRFGRQPGKLRVKGGRRSGHGFEQHRLNPLQGKIAHLVQVDARAIVLADDAQLAILA